MAQYTDCFGQMNWFSLIIGIIIMLYWENKLKLHGKTNEKKTMLKIEIGKRKMKIIAIECSFT